MTQKINNIGQQKRTTNSNSKTTSIKSNSKITPNFNKKRIRYARKNRIRKRSIFRETQAEMISKRNEKFRQGNKKSPKKITFAPIFISKSVDLEMRFSPQFGTTLQ